MGRAILCSSAHRAQMICERGMAQPVVVCASWTIPAPSPKTFCPSPQYTQPHRPPSILPNADRTGQRCNHIRLPPPAPADKLSKATPWIRCPSSPSLGSCPQGEALDTAAKLSVSWQLRQRLRPSSRSPWMSPSSRPSCATPCTIGQPRSWEHRDAVPTLPATFSLR